MAEQPSFSVIVPAWNRAATLKRALASIAAQTVQPLEVIVVDDGSTDGTAELVAVSFPAVRLVRLARNRGSAGARNAGIRLAEGSHLAFLDSDDRWHPAYLARLAEAWARWPEAVFVHADYVKVVEGDPADRRAVTVVVPDDQVGAMLTNNFVHTCSVFSARADRVRAQGGFDPAFKVSHDRALFLRLLLTGRSVHLAECLVDRHVGRDNLINDAASWWQGCLGLIADSLVRPEMAGYAEREPEMRYQLWSAIQWHQRDLERRRDKAVAAEPAPEPAGVTDEGPAVAVRPARPAPLPRAAGLPPVPEAFWPRGIAGVVLFLHAPGVPAADLAGRMAELTGLKLPEPHFALDGPMLAAMQRLGSGDLDAYLGRLADEALAAGSPFLTARLAAPDLQRLAGEPGFRRLFDLPVRALRWRWRCRAIQAVLHSGVAAERGRPSFRRLARALVEIEAAEAAIKAWCAAVPLEAPVLTVEALHAGSAAPLAPALARLALPLVSAAVAPLPGPQPRVRAAARWFRAEARRRHWAHALA